MGLWAWMTSTILFTKVKSSVELGSLGIQGQPKRLGDVENCSVASQFSSLLGHTWTEETWLFSHCKGRNQRQCDWSSQDLVKWKNQTQRVSSLLWQDVVLSWLKEKKVQLICMIVSKFNVCCFETSKSNATTTSP